MNTFTTLDFCIFIAYAILIIVVGLYTGWSKGGKEKDSKEYFLAGNSLAWWAIGASVIASNISAEQFIGMSGSGFVIGLGIASYEFIAAASLIVVAVLFLPIFLKTQIYTMPQFLEIRYSKSVKTVMALFWLLVFIFVNLTSILYLGALAINKVVEIPIFSSIICLALFAGIYAIYGGLKAVALTDLVQVVFLIGGGLLTTYIALDYYAEGQGAYVGIQKLMMNVPEKFDMILDKSNPNYTYLPGIGVIAGGLWVSALYYFGCNQYIIQRALAGKSLAEAQLGLVFAGFLKLILPIIVVVPGIVAFALNAPIDKPDQAYPWLMHNFIPSGVRGIAFAALVAAVVSSLASMVNSITTIFTMDIYKEYLVKQKTVSEKKLVAIGRVFGVISLVIAVVIAPMLGNLEQAFQFIQEFTGFISPGALAIFIMGFFWKRAESRGALAAAIGTFIFSLTMLCFFPEVSFIDRMGYVFLLCILLIVIFGLCNKQKQSTKCIEIEARLFATTRLFKILSFIILLTLGVIYYIFW
ncbi:sodium/sugar symporter [Phocaeicola sp. HCN-40430]|uniref:sodium/sugar symporter n=1 Tax=Phocaeicola sp. HCN-40430 TaxID=3134664 RepID=UPI0030C1E54B